MTLSSLKRGAVVLLAVLTAVLSAIPTAFAEEAEPATSASDQDVVERFSYDQYLKEHADAARPAVTVPVDIIHYTVGDGMQASAEQNYQGKQGASVLTGKEGFIEWQVEVPQTGLYNIAVDYYPMEGNGSDIERELLIDGAAPFDGARTLTFQRVWTDGESMVKDDSGNEYRPFQVEAPRWMSMVLQGSSDYSKGSYLFYLEQGTHTLRLVSNKEPMAISAIRLFQEEELPTYAEKQQEYQQKGYQAATKEILIEGEAAAYRSSPTLYAINDNSSPMTSPTEVGKIRLNTVGGYNWRYQRQWLEWKFTVKETGLYKLNLRTMQNFNEGASSTRTLYIDGEIPFEEAKDLTFEYSMDWQLNSAGGNDTPYLFYLEEGEHTLRLENTLGKISDVLTQMQQTVYQLNGVYRKILMVTGTTPDPNRDYQLDTRLPGVMETLEEAEASLHQIMDKMVELTGTKGTDYARIEKLALQIRTFLDKPNTITASGRLETFRTNVSDNASWLVTASEQPLLIDYMKFVPETAENGKADAGFFSKLFYEIRMFLNSFISDYNAIATGGESEEEKGTVTLWLTSGRDQAQVMRSLTENYFNTQENAVVQIRLVDAAALLPAVAANMGPDVAIQQDRSLPVNYALRNALYDMSQFEDHLEVLERFYESSVEPYWIGDSLYALPETETFYMLFYRTDILAELGLEVPETWDEFYAMIPTLQRNSLEVGLPNLAESGQPDAELNLFFMFLFQNGGTLYNEDKSRTALDSQESIDAFNQWAELYTKYRLPQKMDAVTRFRSGEAPVVLQPINFYNSLSVAATEIQGLWDFAPIPGTLKEDGTIDRSEGAGGTGAIIFKNAKDPELAWRFVKWWTSADIQSKYGQEMECIQGVAARWMTANKEAFEKLPWSSKAAKSIAEQREWVVGLPEVPGSYILPRYVGTAIRLTIDNSYPPQDAILDYNAKINEEIRLKREEFGME